MRSKSMIPLTSSSKKVRQLATCIEQSRRFRFQAAGERVSIPCNATIYIEHERDSSSVELEFQLKWLQGVNIQSRQGKNRLQNKFPCHW
jgi:hypothetical protein